jgi:hypothetical protein
LARNHWIGLIGLVLILNGSSTAFAYSMNITAPSNNATVRGTIAVTTTWNAPLPKNGSEKVWLGSTSIGTGQNFQWDSRIFADRKYVLSARLYNSSGKQLDYNERAITLANGIGSIPTPAPSPTATATPLATPVPTPREQFGVEGYPLTVPVGYGNPMFYGAVGDSSTDDTAAFQKALTAGNVYVSNSGTYLIHGQILLPSNRVFQCAPGVTLKTDLFNTHDTGMLRLDGTTNSQILGCNMVGTNSSVPPKLLDSQGNSPIRLFGATNNLIAGNTCKWATGNSCIHLTDSTDSNQGRPSSGNIIRNNTFGASGLYCLGLIVATDNQILWNDGVNCAMGSEANSGQPTDSNERNTYDHNRITQSVGSGSVSEFGVFLTGGTAIAGMNYSTNIVTNNIVTGTGSEIKERSDNSGTQDASYTNNLCLNGCSVN